MDSKNLSIEVFKTTEILYRDIKDNPSLPLVLSNFRINSGETPISIANCSCVILLSFLYLITLYATTSIILLLKTKSLLNFVIKSPKLIVHFFNIFLCKVQLYIFSFLIYNINNEFINQKELSQIIGKNIKKYRTSTFIDGKKLTQEKLAEAINVSVSLISNLESSKSNKGISIINLYKISVVLNTPISKFFEVSNEYKK